MIGKLEYTFGAKKKKKKKVIKRVHPVECQECGEIFYTTNYEKDKRKFCSRTCASRNMNRKRRKFVWVEKPCKHCGEIMTVKEHENRHNKEFCSYSCSKRYRDEKYAMLKLERLEREYNELVHNL